MTKTTTFSNSFDKLIKMRSHYSLVKSPIFT